MFLKPNLSYLSPPSNEPESESSEEPFFLFLFFFFLKSEPLDDFLLDELFRLGGDALLDDFFFELLSDSDDFFLGGDARFG